MGEDLSWRAFLYLDKVPYMADSNGLKGEAERQILKVAIPGSSVITKSGKDEEEVESSE